ncbi:hypothetical protein [Comamonas sp. JC664]|uniref:hypothetical protein n=1 Tax=Comamonas sp. JC664 TaxID=2801917 RepID=UPI003610EE9D
MKTVIVVFSDPQSGTQEALGRVVNALFLAYELKEKNRDFDLVFQGTGVRWPAELVKPEHPGHALYEAVLDHIVACAVAPTCLVRAQAWHPPALRWCATRPSLAHRRAGSVAPPGRGPHLGDL